MIRIILLRHGETTWNIEGRYQGQEDTPLSPRGIKQGKTAVSYTHLTLPTICSV